MTFSFAIEFRADHSIDSLFSEGLRGKHTIDGQEKFKFGAQKYSLQFSNLCSLAD